jgi:hypothetical protein
MQIETIEVRITESGQLLKVTVYKKFVDHIEVVIGEGQHSMRCTLTPNRMGNAYVGSVRGRELVYERSKAQVEHDIERLQGNAPPPRRR